MKGKDMNGPQKKLEGLLDNNVAGFKRALNKAIKNGFDINKATLKGNFLLAHAIMHRSFDCARILIEKKANVNAADSNGVTPLLLTCEKLYKEHKDLTALEFVKNLIKHGANVNAKNKRGLTALMYLAKNKNMSLEGIQYLVKHGADINIKDCDGWTAAFYAIEYKQIDAAEYLLKCIKIDEKIDIFIELEKEKNSIEENYELKISNNKLKYKLAHQDVAHQVIFNLLKIIDIELKEIGPIIGFERYGSLSGWLINIKYSLIMLKGNKGKKMKGKEMDVLNAHINEITEQEGVKNE